VAASHNQSDLAAAMAALQTGKPTWACTARRLTDAEAAKARADYIAFMATGDREEVFAPNMRGELVQVGVVTTFGGKIAVATKKAA
jgi:hypothetical protein